MFNVFCINFATPGGCSETCLAVALSCQQAGAQ